MVNDNELADRTHRTAEAWEKIADGRANDERLIVSGYQAHDTAQTLRLAAARIRELSAEVERLRTDMSTMHRSVVHECCVENERLRAAITMCPTKDCPCSCHGHDLRLGEES